MSKLHLAVACSVMLDHNDNRLILIPTEEGLAELARARGARLEVEVPVEVEVADVVAPAPAVEEPVATNKAPASDVTPEEQAEANADQARVEKELGAVPPPAPTAS